MLRLSFSRGCEVKTLRILFSTCVTGALLFLIVSCPSPVGSGGGSSSGTPAILVLQDAVPLSSGDMVACGSTVVSVPKDVQIKIKNSGDGDLTLSGDPVFELFGVDADHYSVVSYPSARLPPGATSIFTLRFNPSSTGEKVAAISFTCNDNSHSDWILSLCGTSTAAPEPDINVKNPGNESIVDGSGNYLFGSVIVGSSGDATFTVENVGTADLNLDGSPRVILGGVDAGQFSVTSQPSSPVAASGSTTFTVRFSPTTTGTKSATINVGSDDPDENPYNFSIFGDCTAAAEPDINLKQGAINIADGTGNYDFAATNVGSYTDVSFTIQNLGTAALDLNGSPKVVLTGGDSAMYSVTTQPTSPIAVSGSATFTVRFAPTSAGAKSTTVSVANSDSDENPYTFTITGTGTVPEINLKQGSTNIADGTGSYAFSNTIIGVPRDVIFTIQNVGTGSLSLTGSPRVAVGGTNPDMFTVTIQPPSTVSASGSASFTVRFAPTSIGAKSATISIADNDSDENPYNFTVTGTATSPEINLKQGSTNIADGTGSYSFADTSLDHSTDVVFTIENTGTGTLYLGGSPPVSVSGTNASMFTVLSLPASAVAAGGSTTFTLRFAPAGSIGTKSATVSITNSDSNENPYNFNLTGTAIWQGTRLVDATGNVGQYTSIDASGDYVFIAYYDVGNNDLKFAYSYDGGYSWISKTVDSAGDVGQYCSLDCYYSGTTYYLYVSYYDATNGNLKLAKSTNYGANWTISTVDSTGDTGRFTSISGTSSNVYISYFDLTNTALRFAKSTNGGTSWSVRTNVDSQVGGGTSITWASSDVVIAYRDNTNQALKFARSSDGGATWPPANIKTVDTGNVGFDPSIGLDGNLLYVSYLDTANQDLKFAKSTDLGATWPAANIKSVDTAGSVGYGNSVTCITTGNPSSDVVCVSYYDGTNQDLKFARSDSDAGTTWQVGNLKTVDSTGNVGSDSSITNVGSRIYISYYDTTNGDLKIARSNDGGATW